MAGRARGCIQGPPPTRIGSIKRIFAGPSEPEIGAFAMRMAERKGAR